MPRLFTAIKIPPSIKQWLITLQSGLKGVHWIEPENYHITLRFLGDVDPRTAYEYSSLLDKMIFEPFKIRLKGVGSFGTKKPRTIWAGVEENAALEALQRKHERAAIEIGLPPEQRNYSPHVTLLRPRHVSTRQIETYKYIHSLFQSPSFEVNSFELLSARSSVGGGPYLIEGRYPEGCQIEECHALAKDYL